MKKLLLMILACTLTLALLAVPVQASSAGTATLTITPDKSEVQPGGTVTFTFVMNSSGQMDTLTGAMTFDTGLTYKSHTEEYTTYFGSYGNYNASANNLTLIGGNPPTEWTVLTVTCEVSEDASVGGAGLGVGFAAGDCSSGDADFALSVDAAKVKVVHKIDTDHKWDAGSETKPATCQEPGVKTFTCQTPGCGQTKTEQIPQLSHKWAAAPTWSWGTDNKTATATLRCSSDTPHDEKKTATVTVSNTDATCTKAGTTTYTASATFSNGQTFTDEKKVEGQALGHSWGEPTYTWDGDTVTATRHCTRIGDETAAITVTAKGAKKETPATCTKAGSSYYEATVKFTEDNKSYSVESTPVTIPATGHDIKFYDKQGGTEGKFTWTDTGTTVGATVYVVCANENCDKGYNLGPEVEVKVDQDGNTDATCTKGGTVHYVGTISINDPKHATGAWTLTDTYEKTVSPEGLGHLWYENAVEFHWGEPGEPFMASLKCARCDKVIETEVTPVKNEASGSPASCTKLGNDVYDAVADFTGKDDHKLSKDTVPTNARSTLAVIVDPLGHKWPEPKDVKFTWTDTDPTAPTAALSVSCQNKGCDAHYDTTPQKLTVSVSKTDSTDPKCTEDGSATWSATAKTPDGEVTYSEDGHKTVLPKLGHDWGEPVFNWTEKDGKWDATEASRTCKRDTEHTDKAEATVTAVTTAATYTAAGKTVYTATAEFDGKDVTDTKETVIPKLTASVETNVPAANAGSGAQAALKSSTDALVAAAMSGTKPAGMPDNVFNAIKEAEEKGQDGLAVSTELVVTPTTAPSTIPGAVSAIDASIKITINNTDIEEYTPVTGNLTEVSAPITLKVPKPTSGGPIFWVVAIHNGDQSKPTCTFSGNDILFSTAQFSTFVVVGSNDISNADVTGIDPTYAYTGAVIRPAVKVTINGDNETLTEGTDYTVEYKDNTNVGTATVTITGIGKYTGTVTKTFAITEKPVTATATPAATATAAPSPTSTAGAPATGDETPVALYAGMLVLSAAGLALVLRKKKTH